MAIRPTIPPLSTPRRASKLVPARRRWVPHPRQYLMESADEAVRLEAKTDPQRVRQRLELVGVRPGMRALDAGAGTGAVARVMAEMVRPGGEVIALDFSLDRTRSGSRIARQSGVQNLRFIVDDLYSPALRPQSFDFVWCEFIFEYLAEPDLALSRLAELVRHGGKLVVGDLDGNGMLHYPISAELEGTLNTLRKALQGLFDPNAGRKLYHRFCKLGLVPNKVHVLPYHLYAGGISANELWNWKSKLNTLRPRGSAALGSSARYDQFARAFLDLLRSPDALTYSILFLVEWTRP
jgi:ubiquinone/menaquinone biosynthesis C-methylase UbiE